MIDSFNMKIYTIPSPSHSWGDDGEWMGLVPFVPECIRHLLLTLYMLRNKTKSTHYVSLCGRSSFFATSAMHLLHRIASSPTISELSHVTVTTRRLQISAPSVAPKIVSKTLRFMVWVILYRFFLISFPSPGIGLYSRLLVMHAAFKLILGCVVNFSFDIPWIPSISVIHYTVFLLPTLH